MTRRKSRDGDESRGHKTPASGPKVFPESKGGRKYQIPLAHKDGTEYGIVARWPSGVPVCSKPWPPEPEYIRMSDLKSSSKPLPDDPYETAERLAAERRGAA